MVRRVTAGTDATGAGLTVGEGVLDASGVVATGESDLALLRQGKITPTEYVDRLVQGATRHLEGAISDERLEAIRSVVRAQFIAAESGVTESGAEGLDSDDATGESETSAGTPGASPADTEPRLGALLRRVSA